MQQNFRPKLALDLVKSLVFSHKPKLQFMAAVSRDLRI